MKGTHLDPFLAIRVVSGTPERGSDRQDEHASIVLNHSLDHPPDLRVIEAHCISARDGRNDVSLLEPSCVSGPGRVNSCHACAAKVLGRTHVETKIESHVSENHLVVAYESCIVVVVIVRSQFTLVVVCAKYTNSMKIRHSNHHAGVWTNTRKLGLRRDATSHHHGII